MAYKMNAELLLFLPKGCLGVSEYAQDLCLISHDTFNAALQGLKYMFLSSQFLC